MSLVILAPPSAPSSSDILLRIFQRALRLLAMPTTTDVGKATLGGLGQAEM